MGRQGGGDVNITTEPFCVVDVKNSSSSFVLCSSFYMFFDWIFFFLDIFQFSLCLSRERTNFLLSTFVFYSPPPSLTFPPFVISSSFALLLFLPQHEAQLGSFFLLLLGPPFFLLFSLSLCVLGVFFPRASLYIHFPSHRNSMQFVSPQRNKSLFLLSEKRKRGERDCLMDTKKKKNPQMLCDLSNN